MARYGDGTFYLRTTDGRWVGKVPDGRGRYRYVTGTDEHETRARWRELRKSVRTTTSQPRGGERLRDYLERWLDEVAAVRLRPRTLRGHRQVVANHLVPSLGRFRVADLHQDDVRRMVASLSRTLAPQTVHNIVRVLSSALQHALRDDVVTRNVARLVTLPRRASEQPPSMSTADVRRFLEVTRGHPHWPIWALAFTTGMRRGEVLSLRWADVTDSDVTVAGTYRLTYLANGEAFWKWEEPKTTKSKRTIPLTALGKAAIRAQKAQATSAKFVFARANGDPMSPDHVTHTFGRALAAHGFPAVRFHSLRHSAAVAMLDRLGGDLRAVSANHGHSTIGTTVDVYGSAADDARRRAAAAMDEAMEGMA